MKEMIVQQNEMDRDIPHSSKVYVYYCIGREPVSVFPARRVFSSKLYCINSRG